MRAILPLTFCVFLAGLTSLRAEEEGVMFFEAKIRPVLVKHCYECHSEEEGKARGGLRVDSKRALEQGGDSGPSVVAGDPGASLLVTALQYHDPEYEMPPTGKLPDEVIRDFVRWIDMGTPDPRVETLPVAMEESGIDWEAGRQFWSLVAPRRPVAPVIQQADWPYTAIDHLILASLEREDLTPADDASAETLVRRLYFVLAGLPPTPEAMAQWAERIGPTLKQNEVGELVDFLLASPRFGERWGQHWLDVARYADSTGGDSNNIYPEAWRFRDYVIASMNEDKPFDDFIREQLAGDLLPAVSDQERAERIVATGFLALGQKLVGEVDERKFLADLVDEQIDTTTRAFLGMSVSCARCHDHKADPIPQSDYYAMASFFRNTETRYGLLDAQARQSSTLIDVTGMGLPAGREALSGEAFTALKAERDEAAAAMEEVRRMIRGDGGDVSRAKLRRSRTKQDRTEAALLSYDEDGHPLTLVMGVQDREEWSETRLLVRGELDQPGPVVSPGFLSVLDSPPVRGFEGSGRLQLADWIADEGNPLTSRVIANRVWHWLFGQGLVRSVDEFGAAGEEPTHPELLDLLAVRFVENGWSIKSLIREIVLSRTWQQASAFQPDHFKKDPENRYLWRSNPRRLEAEVIRDAMLTVSGNLEVGPPGNPLLDIVGEGTVGQNVFEPEIRSIESNLRSVYLPRVRNVLPEPLALFDIPDGSHVAGSRDTTTVPLQALYALNHEFVIRQAEGLAAQMVREPAGERIESVYRKVFGRSATTGELAAAQEFAARFGSDHRMLTTYCQALICTAEFALLE